MVVCARSPPLPVDTSPSQIIGGVVCSLGLSCLTLSLQTEPSDRTDAASRPPATTPSSGLDLAAAAAAAEEEEVASEAALRLERRTSAEWRQRGSSSVSSNSPKSPVLPPVDGVFGVDIGGTLAKLVFLEKISAESLSGEGAGKRRPNFLTAQERFGTTGKRYSDLQFPCEQLGGILHFIKFETRCFLSPPPPPRAAAAAAAAAASCRRCSSSCSCIITIIYLL
jgi:hypothetical protein